MPSHRTLVTIGLLGVSSFVALTPFVLGQSSSGQLATSSKDPIAELRLGFRKPPPSARLRCYWWWLNGNTDKVTITHDLEEMKAKGFGGALLVDANGAAQNGNRPVPAGPKFGSPAWRALYVHALKEADRLGLEITLNIMSGWNLGGPDVTPENASKLLTFSRTVIQGGKPADITVPKPPAREGFYRDIALLAYPLHHGAALAPQPNDGQVDHDRSTEHPHDDSVSNTIRYRAAAVESGFSMPDTSAMLDDGLVTTFKNDPGFADASLTEVRVLKLTPGGTLHADLPAGRWELLRIGYTCSGARVSTASDTWQGLAIDYLSRQAFNTYWDTNVEPLLADARPFHSLKYLATDSWELGGTNWTADFREQFLARRGYDPVPYLPIVAGRIIGDRSTSTRFLTDLRRTVADLISANHYDLFAARARQNGLGVQAESGGPHGAPIDALETFRNSAIPQTEFWSQNSHRSNDRERFFTKEAASAANIYGQRLVAQEGETSIGTQWAEPLAGDLKQAFDMAITEGMNRLVWHEFTSSPTSTGLPGQEYFAGTHLNPKVTWWNNGQSFFDYLNRIQFLMQQGTPVDDILYFYGDNVPTFVRYKADDPAHVLPGYDYDVTNQDALLNTIRIEGAELVSPSDIHWRALTLPQTRRVSPVVLQLADRYLRAGGAVISLPPLSPTGITKPEDLRRFNALVAEIWQSCAPGSSHTVGRGHLFCTNDTRAALAQLHIQPDVELDSAHLEASSTTGIDYIHRRMGNTDIYFLRNPSAQPAAFPAIFRATGHAELWDPLTGNIFAVTSAPTPSSSTETHRSRVDLSLPAYGSVILIFTPSDTARAHPRPTESRSEEMQLSSPWSLTIDGQPVHNSDLTSWTSHDSTKYFSGTAVYHATFIAPQLALGEIACLHFNSVREIATIKLNGRQQPSIWAPPYSTCFDETLRPGENNLEIAVTNLWNNRLVGDAQPGSHVSTQTNIALPDPKSDLLPSGLIGPAEWFILK